MLERSWLNSFRNALRHWAGLKPAARMRRSNSAGLPRGEALEARMLLSATATETTVESETEVAEEYEDCAEILIGEGEEFVNESDLDGDEIYQTMVLLVDPIEGEDSELTEEYWAEEEWLEEEWTEEDWTEEEWLVEEWLEEEWLEEEWYHEEWVEEDWSDGDWSDEDLIVTWEDGGEPVEGGEDWWTEDWAAEDWSEEDWNGEERPGEERPPVEWTFGGGVVRNTVIPTDGEPAEPPVTSVSGQDDPDGVVYATNFEEPMLDEENEPTGDDVVTTTSVDDEENPGEGDPRDNSEDVPFVWSDRIYTAFRADDEIEDLEELDGVFTTTEEPEAQFETTTTEQSAASEQAERRELKAQVVASRTRPTGAFGAIFRGGWLSGLLSNHFGSQTDA